MNDRMAARGPDGSGLWVAVDGRIGFAHRRLAIIDLSERGAQPMASADRSLTITFNGEIYNYRALRAELESRGYAFRTESDTEVLLQLYADCGPAMVGRLRGMFAFALWDAPRRRLLLARDPLGIKPLYYADDGWTLRFASQAKALLAAVRSLANPISRHRRFPSSGQRARAVHSLAGDPLAARRLHLLIDGAVRRATVLSCDRRLSWPSAAFVDQRSWPLTRPTRRGGARYRPLPPRCRRAGRRLSLRRARLRGAARHDGRPRCRDVTAVTLAFRSSRYFTG
jgi:hypothetical protein